MSLYGLRTYDENEQVEIDVTTRLSRIVHTETVSANSSATVTIPGLDPSRAIAISVAQGGVAGPTARVVTDGLFYQAGSDGAGLVYVVEFG